MMPGYDSLWEPGPAIPQLKPGELHLWLAHLDLPSHAVTRLHQALSADEQGRARKYRFADDARRFIAARGALRTILAAYTGLSPEAVKFDYSSSGKPRLAVEPSSPAGCLSFNLSHSGEFALYAIGLERRIGVDVELVRPQVAEERIAEHFFSPQEVDALRHLPPDEQVQAFFRCWTRKEAYIKGRGEGLAIPLNRFSVSLRPGEPAALLEPGDAGEESAHWSLHAVNVAPGYEAAVAVDEEPSLIRHWLFRFDP